MSACGRNVEEPDKFQGWANSLIISPWGKVLEHGSIDEEILMQEINLDEIDECRSQLMYSKQRRNDIYYLEHKL